MHVGQDIGLVVEGADVEGLHHFSLGQRLEADVPEASRRILGACFSDGGVDSSRCTVLFRPVAMRFERSQRGQAGRLGRARRKPRILTLGRAVSCRFGSWNQIPDGRDVVSWAGEEGEDDWVI